MEPSLVFQSNLLPHPVTAPEVVSEFVERSAETVRESDVSEPPHRVVALLDAPVVLFQAVVEIATVPVDHLGAEG
jgi:hypothetical protein